MRTCEGSISTAEISLVSVARCWSLFKPSRRCMVLGCVTLTFAKSGAAGNQIRNDFDSHIILRRDLLYLDAGVWMQPPATEWRENVALNSYGPRRAADARSSRRRIDGAWLQNVQGHAGNLGDTRRRTRVRQVWSASTLSLA